MREHYTTYEAAEVFGVSLQTIYNWVRTGKLRAVKIGKSWYIPKEAVSELLENGEKAENSHNERQKGGAT